MEKDLLDLCVAIIRADEAGYPEDCAEVLSRVLVPKARDLIAFWELAYD